MLIPIILIVVIALSGLAITSYTQVKNQLVMEMVKGQLNSTLSTTVNTIKAREEIMEITKAALYQEQISLTKSIAELINENPEVLTDEYMIGLAKKLNVSEIHVIDENGIIVVSTVPGFYGFDFHSSDQTRPFLEGITNKNFALAQEPSIRGTDKTLFQYIGISRVDQPGIVQIGLEPKAIQDLMAKMNIEDLIKEIHIGDSGYAHVIGLDGKTIAHPDDKKIGESIKELEWATPLFNNNEGEFTYTLDGVTNYGMFKNIGDKIVSVVYPETEFITELNNLRTLIVVVLLIIILALSIIIPLLLNKQVINPIKKLVNAMNLVGTGDLNVNVAVKSKDEIGQLGTNFNKMVNDMKNMSLNIKNTVVELKESSEIIENSAEEVSVSSEEISKTIQEIAAGATNQAEESSKGLETTINLATTIDDMTDKLKSNYENAMNMKEKNNAGIQTVSELKTNFAENTKATIEVANGVAELSAKSVSIGSIVETINSIAEQTNLLALNAAIVKVT